MNDRSQLLRIAVEDNIAWCSRICSSHGSNETDSSATWVNLAVSPPFYPNIITRQRGALHEVEELANRVRLVRPSGGWGIKDSFADLTLTDQGFERVLSGHWYGGTVAEGHQGDWNTIMSADVLRAWRDAWGSSGDAVFPESLLEDRRINFWSRGGAGAIEAGFISFDTGFSLGLSNWFSLGGESFAEMGILQAAGSISHGMPIVCWATEDLSKEGIGLAELGPLQVWIAR